MLAICLEGSQEVLVCNVVAIEYEARVKQPNWPKEIDAKDISYSALNHVRGNLLPGDLKRFFRMTWIQRAF